MALNHGENDCMLVHDVEHDVSENRPLVETLVEAIAEVEGVEMTELDSLHDSVDVEQLERLLYSGRSSALSSGIVGFVAHGWTIFVHADGRIRICDPADGADPSSMITLGDD